MAMRSYRATFTGVEPYVDVSIAPAMVSPTVAAQGITLDDTTSTVLASISLLYSNTVARVEPTSLFIGYVDFLLEDI